MIHRLVAGQAKDCCKADQNRGPVEDAGPGLWFRRCTVCHCRHFVGVAEPVHVGMKAS